MSSLQRLIITSNGTTADFKSQCDLAMGGLDATTNFAAYIDGLAGGNMLGASLEFQVGAVQATATITSTGTAANNQTMTLANQTITAKTSGAVAADGEFNISGTVATQAASIAAAINAMPELVGIVTAAANLGVVTVTSVVPGLIGNGLQIVDVDLANVAVAAFAGGTDGTAYTIDLR
jgi:hypothetical protein